MDACIAWRFTFIHQDIGSNKDKHFLIILPLVSLCKLAQEWNNKVGYVKYVYSHQLQLRCLALLASMFCQSQSKLDCLVRYDGLGYCHFQFIGRSSPNLTLIIDLQLKPNMTALPGTMLLALKSKWPSIILFRTIDSSFSSISSIKGCYCVQGLNVVMCA